MIMKRTHAILKCCRPVIVERDSWEFFVGGAGFFIYRREAFFVTVRGALPLGADPNEDVPIGRRPSGGTIGVLLTPGAPYPIGLPCEALYEGPHDLLMWHIPQISPITKKEISRIQKFAFRAPAEDLSEPVTALASSFAFPCDPVPSDTFGAHETQVAVLGTIAATIPGQDSRFHADEAGIACSTGAPVFLDGSPDKLLGVIASSDGQDATIIPGVALVDALDAIPGEALQAYYERYKD